MTPRCSPAVALRVPLRLLQVVYLRHQELIEEVRATARAEGVSEIVVGIPSGRTVSRDHGLHWFLRSPSHAAHRLLRAILLLFVPQSQSRKCFEFAERLADATYREGWRIWLADESYRCGQDHTSRIDL